MKCKEFLKNVSSYIEETASQRLRREMDRHIDECRPCRKTLERMSRMLDLLGEADVMQAPDEFEALVMDRLEERERRRFPAPLAGGRKVLYGLAGAAALILACFAVYYPLSQRGGGEGTEAEFPPGNVQRASATGGETLFFEKLETLTGGKNMATIRDDYGNTYIVLKVREEQGDVLDTLGDLIFLGGDSNNEFLLRKERAPRSRRHSYEEDYAIPNTRPAFYRGGNNDLIDRTF